MYIALDDNDNSLNLYDFGKNPAWLLQDQKFNRLKFFSSANNYWSNYKRKYDPLGIHNQNLTIISTNQLSNKGTFLGYITYSLERRSDQPKTLKYDTYAGEAFFSTDSVTGNFDNNGPAAGFQYSIQPFNSIFLGAEINYKILNGLKNNYSHAKTLYREFNGKLGLAYQLSTVISVGVLLGLYDSQESIESKSEELTDLEIYNYRGETYYTVIRGNIIEQKIRKKGLFGEVQLFYSPAPNLQFAFKASEERLGTYIYIPKPPLIDFEEGYADFNFIKAEIKGRYFISKDYTFGAMISYNKNKSWSKNSFRNLLIWEWNNYNYDFGVGFSYHPEAKNFLIGCEYKYSYLNTDSSKYIDNRFINNLFTNNHSITFGGEYKVYNNINLRMGYNYLFYLVDLTNGGKNINGNFISSGLGFIFNKSYLDISMIYGRLREAAFDRSRKNFGLSASVIINEL